ncbi:MAG TPA: VOC family protein [Candidatus Limnocylindrales bacterium]|nr:VOC family protein [Candidatus Limnocylindrales bacterium]
MKIQELGHVVLYVSNLERSRHFYRDILGFREIASRGNMAVFSSGRTHHELLLIEVGANATPIPSGRRLGMYHFGLKIGNNDEDLRSALKELKAAGVSIIGASDHTVTHSLYIEDPDGNEIELYIDVQPEIWRENPQAILAEIKPLKL